MKILYKGNCHTPQRFHDYQLVDGLSDETIKDLKLGGWFERELTPTEETRVQREGCLGDVLDSFETMYGKTIYNKG